MTSSVVDHLRNTRRSLVKHIVTTDSGPFITPAQDASDAVSSFVSPTGSLVAVLREAPGRNDEKKRFVEVWKGNSLHAIADVTKLHGSFYTDGMCQELSLIVFVPLTKTSSRFFFLLFLTIRKLAMLHS